MRNLFVVLSIILGVSASPAFSAPAGTKTFQGGGYIEAVNEACTSLGDASVGDHYRVVYLYQGTTNVNEGLAFISGRSDYLIQSSAGSLNGAVSTMATGISGHATLYTQAGSVNLTIASVGGLSTADAVNLKVVGSINDFYDTGCNVTFHAVLTARPNE